MANRRKSEIFSSAWRGLFSSPRVIVVLAPFILLAPVWLAGKALYWGTPSTQFIPWWWQAWQTLRSGELPLWNPLLGMGAPLLANYQSALFYPPNWLYFLLAAVGGLPWMAWGQAFLVAAHLAWAGWGMLLLVRRLGLSELAQVVGGLAFSLSGYLVARAHFLSINTAVAWLPWVLLAAFDLVHAAQDGRAVLKLGLVLALQWLAGHAQIAWYTLLLAVVWIAFWALWTDGWPKLRQSFFRFVAAALIALVLSVVQLLPTAEYLLHSQRAGQVDAAQAMTYSFWPWRFITLALPNFFGNPGHGDYWGYGNYWEDALYIGLLPLFLALSAIIGLRRKGKQRTLFIFLVALIVCAFLLALGKYLPIFPWLFEYVPNFNLFHSPTRFSLWAIFALALLASYGAESWQRPKGRELYWPRLGIAAAVALLFSVGLAAFLQSLGFLTIPTTFFRAMAMAGVLALGAAWLNLRAPKGKQAASGKWTWLVAGLISIDLLYAGWGLNPGTSLDLYQERPELHAALREQLGDGRLYLPADDERVLKFEHLFRFDDFYSEDPRSIRATLLPNINLLDAIPSANNFDPLQPQRYKAWIDALELSPAEIKKDMLKRMDVTVVERLIPSEGASVSFETFDALPRARWVDCARAVESSASALEAVLSGDYDPVQNVVIETPGASPETMCGTGARGHGEILHSSANRVQLRADAPGGGWVILADTWYPGWHAIVNGEEQPIYVADILFRAVLLPEGKAEIEFIYRPLSFTFGLVLSALAWPTWFFLWRREQLE